MVFCLCAIVYVRTLQTYAALQTRMRMYFADIFLFHYDIFSPYFIAGDVGNGKVRRSHQGEDRICQRRY